jgi:hypothetical protein
MIVLAQLREGVVVGEVAVRSCTVFHGPSAHGTMTRLVELLCPPAIHALCMEPVAVAA